MSWKLQDAKQRFSELVRRTLEEGLQVVTRHGREVVVVVPADEYEGGRQTRTLTRAGKQRSTCSRGRSCRSSTSDATRLRRGRSSLAGC
jgi:prevent-host-death family protein